MSEIVFNNTRSYSYCHDPETNSKSTDNRSSSNLNPVKVLTRMWNAFTKKIDRFQRPSIANSSDMRALGKSFRRSLRINKSAKKKGYDHFYTDEEKRWGLHAAVVVIVIYCYDSYYYCFSSIFRFLCLAVKWSGGFLNFVILHTFGCDSSFKFVMISLFVNSYFLYFDEDVT